MSAMEKSNGLIRRLYRRWPTMSEPIFRPLFEAEPKTPESVSSNFYVPCSAHASQGEVSS